jgi:Uma2 family endonuclease
MTTARPLRSYSYDEYLHALEASHIKLEYIEGEIYAMAGGTPAHAQLGARIIGLLQRSLPAGCTVYSSDLKVFVEHSDLATFPDGSVICGPLQPAARDANAAVNPTIVIEVTSPSTEHYDRTEKLRGYKQLSSLQAVLLVSHRARRITIVERTADGWVERDARGGEQATLAKPALRFAVDDAYEGVPLDDPGAR